MSRFRKNITTNNSLINEFDWQTYINNYEDLRNAGINTQAKAWVHWTRCGMKEGRTYKKIGDLLVENTKVNNIVPTLINNSIVSNNINDNFDFIDDFNSIYNVTKEQVLSNPKIEFRYICFKYLNYIRQIEFNEIAIKSAHDAVLIEYRCFPHLEFLIRNTINKLGEKWSHTVICGILNYEYIVNMCNKISPQIKIIKTGFENLDQNTYIYQITHFYI
jgi:hypothetical protein